MTYFVTALTNDRAQLIVATVQTTDKTVAEFAWANFEARGYIVVRKEEG